MSLVETQVLGNLLWRWIMALVVTAVAFLIFLGIRMLVVRRLTPKAEATRSKLDDAVILVVRKTGSLFLLLMALYVATLCLSIPPHVARIFRQLLLIGFCLQVALWGNALIKFWIIGRARPGEVMDKSTASAYGILAFLARLFLWMSVFLWLLSNLGVNITAVVAGLGIGGIAIALAVQSILGDVLNSITIVLDKPFEVGDFITVDNFLGTVERIGIKTTRVRSLQGEQIVFSNTDLIHSRIQNFKHMRERRIQFNFGVVYQTPVEKLQRIPGMVRQIIESIEGTRCDRVHFKSLGDSALMLEVVYYVSTQDYNIYMDTQQAINLALCKQFETEGIEFAYPTRTLYVNQTGSPV